jgi:hypothetical protein
MRNVHNRFNPLDELERLNTVAKVGEEMDGCDGTEERSRLRMRTDCLRLVSVMGHSTRSTKRIIGLQPKESAKLFSGLCSQLRTNMQEHGVLFSM